jgi:hypothetical protein
MIYIKDVTVNLSQMKNLNELSYEWLRILKYKYEKSVELEADASNDLQKCATVKQKNKYENFHAIQMTTRVLYDFEFNGKKKSKSHY